jgi:hypothetical protein
MANLFSLSHSSKNTVITLIVFVLAFDVAFVGQKLGGAYQNEFGGHPHEAAHYLAGLFWRDLAVSVWRDRAEGKREPLSEEKRSFTQNWDAHYPYLETGSERSLFNGLEAVWMLAFPATRGSLLILLAGLSAIAATQLFCALQQEYGWAGAGLAAAAFLVLPPIRKYTGLVMPDILSVVLAFGAAMAFGDFLDRERGRDAWLAGILGGLAILNSESGCVLWLVLLIAFVMARKFRLLRKPALWGMTLLIGATLFLRGGLTSMETVRLSSNPFWGSVGWGVGALVVIGFFMKGRQESEFSGRWKAAVALLVVLAVLHSILALPAGLMVALAGGDWLIKWVSSRPRWGGKGAKFRAPFAAIFGTLALMSLVGPWRRETCAGFAPLVATLIQDAGPEDVTLVSSDPSGEERFIAELAMREERPGHAVLCGTRLLANPGKKFIADEAAFPDDQAVFDFLTSGRVKYIVVDDALPDEDRREHHYQIHRAIEEHLSRFWVIASCPVTRDGVEQLTPAKLYKIRLTGNRE